jgi:predicted transposase YbfD/YdcC
MGAVRENGTQVHLLSAFVHGQGTTIAQREIAEKTNEIPELRVMLKDMDVHGQVVTADALHTQRETVCFLVEEKRAHSLFTNRSHYVRDTTYDEDRSQIRTRNGPRMMATFVVPEESNILINPEHTDAAVITATVVRKWINDTRIH